MNPLIGRKEELKKLQTYLTSRKFEFVAIYGVAQNKHSGFG